MAHNLEAQAIDFGSDTPNTSGSPVAAAWGPKMWELKLPILDLINHVYDAGIEFEVK